MRYAQSSSSVSAAISLPRQRSESANNTTGSLISRFCVAATADSTSGRIRAISALDRLILSRKQGFDIGHVKSCSMGGSERPGSAGALITIRRERARRVGRSRP